MMKKNGCKWISMIALCLLLLPVCGLAEGGSVVEYLAADSQRPGLDTEALFEVHIIKADSSDSILLRAGGETMLVDSSTSSRAHLVINYLTKLGISKLDYAFLTHTHSDHMGGFHRVLAEIPAGLFLHAPCAGPKPTVDSKKLYNTLRKNDIPYEEVQHEQEIDLGGVKLRFLNWENSKVSQNNRSMIIHAQFGDRTILLGADIEGKAQAALAETYGNELAADLMKVPHHGMINYLDAFWQAVQPEFALVSCTPKRVPRLVKRMDEEEIQYAFTSDGNIVAVSDGEIWQVWHDE